MKIESLKVEGNRLTVIYQYEGERFKNDVSFIRDFEIKDVIECLSDIETKKSFLNDTV